MKQTFIVETIKKQHQTDSNSNISHTSKMYLLTK